MESDIKAEIPNGGWLEGLNLRTDPESTVYVVPHPHSYFPRAFGGAGQISDRGPRSERRPAPFREPGPGARAHEARPAAIRTVARGGLVAGGTRIAPPGPF